MMNDHPDAKKAKVKIPLFLLRNRMRLVPSLTRSSPFHWFPLLFYLCVEKSKSNALEIGQKFIIITGTLLRKAKTIS